MRSGRFSRVGRSLTEDLDEMQSDRSCVFLHLTALLFNSSMVNSLTMPDGETMDLGIALIREGRKWNWKPINVNFIAC